MRWRAIAIVLLGVNMVLAAAWIIAPRRHSAPGANGAGLAELGGSKTNILLRRQPFSWQDIESADYPSYIVNLRGIGCPEQTIRDIIIADVNALYARRRATELVTAEQQWWRSRPDTNVLRAAIAKARELEVERRGLLTRLLGPNWESGEMASLPRPSHPGVVLDGPLLGALPPEIKQRVQEISARSQERLQAYLDAQRSAGKEPDPMELAKLRQQTRDDLAQVLSPGQLEEFLLRYSQYANNLRAGLGQLQFFNATADEFRAIFRATDTLDQQIQLLGAGTDANTVLARKALEDEEESAIKLALGPKRYEEYRRLHDPLYRQAVAAAQDAGTPEAAQTLYQINQAAAAQQQSILADTTLTTNQKNIALKSLEVDQLKANAIATGQEPPPEPPPPPPANPTPPNRTYVLGPGDTAAVVAMTYGVPVSALKAANPNLNFNSLKPGDSLVIPPNPLTSAPP